MDNEWCLHYLILRVWSFAIVLERFVGFFRNLSVDFEVLLMLKLIPTKQVDFWKSFVVVIDDAYLNAKFILDKSNPMRMSYRRINIFRHTVLRDKSELEGFFLSLTIDSVSVSIISRGDVRIVVANVGCSNMGRSIVGLPTCSRRLGVSWLRTKRTRDSRRNLVNLTKFTRVKILTMKNIGLSRVCYRMAFNLLE